MKKSIIVVSMAAVLLMLVASCKKENSTSKVVLRAGIASSPAKTYVDMGNLQTSWKEEDHIRVNGNEMSISQRYGAHNVYDKADFVCENWNGPVPTSSTQLYAIYPATEQRCTDVEHNIWESKVSLSATQPYVENGFMDNLPMGVSTANEELAMNFHNLTTVFGVPVRTDAENVYVNKVVMEKVMLNPENAKVDGTGNYPLVASMWYPHAGTEVDKIEVIGGESYSITVESKNPVLIPTTSTGTEFYFVAFPVDMPNGVKFHFYNNDVEICDPIYKTWTDGKVEPNTVYDLVEYPTENDRTPWTINPNR